jgi:hypothetical protein
METPTLPFGLEVVPFDGTDYLCSRTGVIFHPLEAGQPLQVVSFVNGTMCVNPIGDFICAINFDSCIGDILDGKYRAAQANEPNIAYLNTKTGQYQELPYSP